MRTEDQLCDYRRFGKRPPARFRFARKNLATGPASFPPTTLRLRRYGAATFPQVMKFPKAVNNNGAKTVRFTTKDLRADKKLSRREVAQLLRLHPDSVSRILPEGLGSAVTSWGGRSKRMQFSRWMVLRWDRARSCRRYGGTPCVLCKLVLEDAQVVAKHLLEVRHGVGESCDPKNCGYVGGISPPCGLTIG